MNQGDPPGNLLPQEVLNNAPLQHRGVEAPSPGAGAPVAPSGPRVAPAVPAAANEDSVSPGTRFSARSMASQRKRLGLSAAECGLLIGASAQSVYNWEEGKARPRAQHLPAIFALRNLGRRQASEILETRKAA
jgi:DNA-binding transcriptional regulator YiaG